MKFPSPYKQHVLPHEIELGLPPDFYEDRFYEDSVANRFVGSIVGLAAGDALGASVEFRPHQFFTDHPVRDMEGGGTWGLKAGQWTDDTSMALCLASSLLTKHGYDPYDQMVRYKWWYKHGYLSSTGSCFDIGNATRDSLEKFIRRQRSSNNYYHYTEEEFDNLSWDEIKSGNAFEVNCSTAGVAGNGALMRLAPVPLFFYRFPDIAVEYAGRSGRLTHGDTKAVDACRYYAALIVAAVRGEPKDEILREDFYKSHQPWFGSTELHPDILRVAKGSYKNPNGYDGGIRGKGYIVNALEAALWAFWSDKNSFEIGALAAVNLGDDTDTTAAIYGQLAGAFYGYKSIPKKWREKLYAHKLLVSIGQWLYCEGQKFDPSKKVQKMTSSVQTSNKTLSNKQQSSTPWTSTDHADVNASGTYPIEIKHTSKSRSDNNELPLSRQDYGGSRVRQQSDEQARSHLSSTSQWPEHQQDTDRSRSERGHLEQPRAHRSEYQQPNSLSLTQQPSIKEYSTSQVNNYQGSPYGTNFGQSLKYTSSYKEPSAYGLDIRPSPVGNLGASQVTQHYLSDTQQTNPSISQSPRRHPTDRVVRVDTNYGSSYGPDQIHGRTYMNNQSSVNERNFTHALGRETHHRSRPSQYSGDIDRVASSSSMHIRPLLSSNSLATRDLHNQAYYDTYKTQDPYYKNYYY
jgi:ADP-ribosylglycohydrolase